MRDMEGAVVSIIFLVLGVGGWLLILSSVAGVDTGTWSFTGHEIAAALMPMISYLWLVACIGISGYAFWRYKD